MNRRTLLSTLGATAVAALGRPSLAGDTVSDTARRLYDRAIIFDANLAPPLPDKLPVPKVMLDLVRASGVTAMKTSLGGVDEKFEDTVGEIAFLQQMFEENPDVFLQIRRHSDIAEAKRSKRTGVILSFEAITMLEGKIERIELFRGLGVRVMQLSYNIASPFGMGVLGDPKKGLTPLGAKAVATMNTHGVAIDISHANEKTSYDVLKASKVPAIITHAGASAVHPHPRNKSDALLKAVAQKGGVIGIYDLPYLAPSPRQPNLDDYMAHMTHVLNVCGEDHVGVGSDQDLTPFDTSAKGLAEFKKDEEHRHKAGVAAPEEDRPPYTMGLNTPRRSEAIAAALLKRGYSERVVEKALGLNFVAALGRIWQD